MRHRFVTLAVLVVCAALLVTPARSVDAASSPSVSSFTPTTGTTAGGSVVTIYGSGFVSGAFVSIGGVLSPTVTVVNASTITAITPAGVAGSAQIVVINPDGQTAYANGYLYSATGTATNNGSLWVAGINPPTGAVGQLVTVTGGGFDPSAIAYFGGIASNETVRISAGYLMAYAPPGLSGSVTVSVKNPDGLSASAPGTFTYNGTGGTSTGAVSITSLTPASTGGGNAFTIYGNGFVSGATVSVGGYPASNVSVVSSAVITATAPYGPSGLTTVTVTNPGGASGAYTGLSYGGTTSTTTGGTQPSIASVSPSIGSSAGGTVVTIYGSGFVAPATVTFGGVPATTVTVISGTQISATAPANPVGKATVLVSGPSGAVGGLTSGFTYELAWPKVTSISPSTGVLGGGTTLTIAGTGFAPGATVTIGGQPAATVSAVSPTQIVVSTPPGPAGAAVVLVTNPGGAISGLASGFAYSSNPEPQAPPPTTSSTGTALTITGVTPTTGPSGGGTPITIFGSGFVSGASVSVGGVSVAATVLSSSQIAVSTPPVSGTGNVAVSVANPGADAFTLPGAFTYVEGASSSGGTPPATVNPLPAEGGLFVFAGGSNEQLLAASGCDAASAVFWTTDAGGTWVGYIPSVPVAVVNAGWTALFPNGIPAGTPIFARC